eukprot:1924062-Rhodomonas_salina.1
MSRNDRYTGVNFLEASVTYTDRSSLCDTAATCANSAGSFACACDPGWATAPGAPPGTACLDVDECAPGMSVTAPGVNNLA